MPGDDISPSLLRVRAKVSSQSDLPTLVIVHLKPPSIEFTSFVLASRLRASWMEARGTKVARVSARFSILDQTSLASEPGEGALDVHHPAHALQRLTGCASETGNLCPDPLQARAAVEYSRLLWLALAQSVSVTYTRIDT